MKKDIAEKWVTALRSGKYKQGDAGELRDGNGGYCCLGVLCDLADEEGVVDAFADDTLPAETVRKWAGLKDCDPTPRGTDIPLSSLNDGMSFGKHFKRRATFAELADVIEEEYKSL